MENVKIITISGDDQFYENTYIIFNKAGNDCFVIDPGCNILSLINLLKENNFCPKYILLTHGHIDHISCLNELRELTKASVCVHKNEIDILSTPFKNLSSMFYHNYIVSLSKNDIIFDQSGEILFNNIFIKVISTPGHTPGGVCYLVDNILFTGDTLFNGSIGRTDFPGGSSKQLIKSLKERVLTLPRSTFIYPGHGKPSTISNEISTNYFLNEDL